MNFIIGINDKRSEIKRWEECRRYNSGRHPEFRIFFKKAPGKMKLPQTTKRKLPALQYGCA